ncbi:MAG: LPXTG cell wall anchor domain-containing protein, partial [Eubacterium sp.]|nr:LPXTG cell wall anchor domain-containing protein [Eubacterium sp.]
AKTAVITDKLPDGVKFVSADQEGVYSEADHTVTWNVITDAHTEGTVTVKVKVLASAAGTELNNQARVGMDEADITTVTDNGSDDDDTTTNFVAVKTVVNAEGTEIDKQVVAVDDLVTYHIPYQNHSKNTRTITITDVLPQDVTYVEASEGGNVQSIVHGQTVIWVLEAAPDTDGEVWVTVKVTKALKGQAFANSAMLEVKDQETGQTKKAVTNQVINYVLDDVVKEVLSENGRKNLEGEKVKGGRTLLYRVTFKNPATTERTFTVTDELPEGVTFVSAENEGTYDEAAKTITWTVNLASGKSQTVSFLVTVDKTADCDFIQNVAKIHVDETDADSNPVKVYVKGDKSTDPENQDPKDDPNPDDQKPDDGKPADDPKTDDGTPSDDPKTEDTTPKDDDKTPADDTKMQDDQKPVITPTETDDKKDTTTPTQDSSKSDDDTKKTTVKDNTGSNDDSGKGQSTPGSDGKGQSTQTTAPKTGDESNVTLWAILMLAAVCAAGGLGIFAVRKGRRRR